MAVKVGTKVVFKEGLCGDWVGRNDLLWKWKCDVKLVSEDGSLEDVL